MKRTTTKRLFPARPLLCAAAGLWLSASAARGHGDALAQAPIVRQQPDQQQGQPSYQQPVQQQGQQPYRPMQQGQGGQVQQGEQGRIGPYHQHLAEWMDSHRNLPLDQQQRALEAEPGFRQLRPEVQQRMHERLMQLNEMNPNQRQRTLARTEAMERLTPPQRLQVRSALTGLGALPEDRRRMVARTFRSMQGVPEPQRQAYLNSPQMRAQFSDQERTTLSNLFAAEPFLPPAAPVQPRVQRPMQGQIPDGMSPR